VSYSTGLQATNMATIANIKKTFFIAIF